MHKMSIALWQRVCFLNDNNFFVFLNRRKVIYYLEVFLRMYISKISSYLSKIGIYFRGNFGLNMYENTKRNTPYRNSVKIHRIYINIEVFAHTLYGTIGH